MKRITSRTITNVPAQPEAWAADIAFNALAAAFDKKGDTIKVRRVDLETAIAAYNEKASQPTRYEAIAVAPYRLRANRQLCQREKIMDLCKAWRKLNEPSVIFHRSP